MVKVFFPLSISFVVGALLLTATAPAKAVLLIESNGQVSGIKDLKVNGTLYDVTFLGGNSSRGSFDNIFGGLDVNTLEFWNDFAGANDAAVAISSALGSDKLLKGGTENVTSSNSASDAFLIPWALNNNNIKVVGDFDYRSSVDLLNVQSQIGAGTTSLLSPLQSTPVPKAFKWAIFEQSSQATPVPTPAAVLPGLVGMGTAMFQKRKKDAGAEA